MALPVMALATSTVEVAGEPVELRSLSRSEVLALAKFDDDPEGAECFMLSRSTGATVDEAKAWFDSVDAQTGGNLLEAIAVLSGIRPGKGPKGNV